MRPRMNPSLSPPFYELDEYTFQDLCCDLFARQPGIATCNVYGKRGQRQRGIDLLAHRSGDGKEVASVNAIRISHLPKYGRQQQSSSIILHIGNRKTLSVLSHVQGV